MPRSSIFRFGVVLAMLPYAAACAIDPGTQVVRLSADDLARHPAFCAVPEMEFIPEVDSWPPYQSAEAAGDATAFAKAWTEQRQWVGDLLPGDLAKGLSRWARPQMEKYGGVAPIEKIDFHPVSSFQPRGMIVYEAIADNLPTHSKLVTRQLKLYVLYNTESKSIVRVTVTIRGEAME